ncbi:MAG: threonine/serine dehydratase [Beijerinckiaceae bacterium]|nr:threonine/serine dehydratase [Beijerinckiaceae bacterium]MCZ8301556.1 threonine/serine dehydratase [Beijerinckiaceae bacterium]
MSLLPVTHDDIRAAHARIRTHIRRTPVLELPRGALGGDFTPILKFEHSQLSGSFKARGAFNSLLSLAVPEAGVAAASGGNHGAAVAFAARALGIPARIFVPEISPAPKIAAIRRYGADVVIGGAQYDDAQAACDLYVAETGALKIHPFSAPATIAGQGTLGLEWSGQAELDEVVIAVGGGGLVSGAAAWFHGTSVKVIGVEPEGSRALHAALEAGGPVEVTVKSVAADSLGARNVGPLVHEICAAGVHKVALVQDEAILAAIRTSWQDFHQMLEPGGAAALGAILSGAYRPEPGARVGILLCGGNVDLHRAAEWAV